MNEKVKVVPVSFILRFLLSLCKVDNKEDKRTRLPNFTRNDSIIIYLNWVELVILYTIILLSFLIFLTRIIFQFLKRESAVRFAPNSLRFKDCQKIQAETKKSSHYKQVSSDPHLNIARVMLGDGINLETVFDNFKNYPHKEISSINGNETGGTVLSEHEIGDEVVFTIFWRNDEKERSEITITDFLTQSLDFISATEGGIFDEASRQVIWNLGSRDSGEKSSVELKVRVNETGTESTKFENRAYVNRVATNKVESHLKRKGSLEIKKRIEGDARDKERRFLFTLILEENINGDYGEMVFRDGVASFTLADNEAIQGHELPADSQYIITIVNGHDFETESIKDSGFIPADEMESIEFVSSRRVVNPDLEEINSLKFISEDGLEADLVFDENNVLTEVLSIKDPQSGNEKKSVYERGNEGYVNSALYGLEIKKEQSINGGIKTVDNLSAKINDRITYYLEVKNVGVLGFKDILVSDSVPTGMELISIASGGTYQDGLIMWTIDLNTGMREVLSFDCRITDDNKFFENSAEAVVLNMTAQSNAVVIEIPEKNYNFGKDILSEDLFQKAVI